MMGYQLPDFPEQLRPSNFPDLQERMERVVKWRKDALDAHKIANGTNEERIDLPLLTFLEGQESMAGHPELSDDLTTKRSDQNVKDRSRSKTY